MHEKELKQEYDVKKKVQKQLMVEVMRTLEAMLCNHKIIYDKVEGRVKEWDSFLRKSKELRSPDPFNEIRDFTGTRIICVLRSDMYAIGELIERDLYVIKRDDKFITKPDETFGYLSLDYVAQLGERCSGPIYDTIRDLKFEVQLRTIAMHAWSTVSRYIDYKSTYSIPSLSRRNFQALSALFYLADSELERGFNASRATKETAEMRAQEERLDEEINLDTLSAFLKKKFPDRTDCSPKCLATFIDDLREVGYVTISQLNTKINEGKNEADQEEAVHIIWLGEGIGEFDVEEFAREAVRAADRRFSQARPRGRVV